MSIEIIGQKKYRFQDHVCALLAVLAAVGCAALQGSAIVFHLSRGEAANTPFNFFLGALALFVAWGRRYKAPLPSRMSR